MTNVIGGKYGHLFQTPGTPQQTQQPAPARRGSPNSFIVRVMLRGATPADYDTLHGEMEQLGFEREIVSSDGSTYKLPDAEYVVDTQAPIDSVLSAAQHAARQTGKQAAIVVTEIENSIFSGLEQVR